jgi:glycosyltransferase involved in cell wall biosynthesis/tetratricopeptide (TPR) repeat protein
METPLAGDLQLKRELRESEFAQKAQNIPELPSREGILELAANGEDGVARHLILNWLSHFPDDESGLETISLLESVDGKTKQNGGWCKILLEKFPRNVIGLKLRLNESDDDGYSQSSDDIALELLQIEPSNEAALSHMTRRSMRFRDWSKAVEYSEALLRINEADQFALLSSARGSSALGEPENAADLWERAHANADFSDDEIFEASRAMYNARRFSRVIDLLHSKCENSEATLKMMELLIRAQYSLGLSEDCAKSSVKLLDSEQDNSVGLRYLSRSLIQLGRLSESIPILEKNCEVDPTSSNSWELLIETHLRMDRVDSASEAWARLKAKSIESLQLFFAAADVAVRFHWQDEYEGLIENEGKMFSDRNGYIEGLARICLDVGDIARSWGLLKEHGVNPFDTGLKEEFETIFESTSATEEELDNATGLEAGLWVPELVVKEVFRRAIKRRVIRTSRPRCHMISSSLDRGGAERQVALTLRHMAVSSNFDCALAVHRAESRVGFGSYLNELGAATERVFRLNEIDLDDVGTSGYETIHENSDLLRLLGTSTRRKVEQLISHFEEHRPDLVHAWQDETIMTTAIAAALTGVPRVVGSARSLRPDEKTELHIRKRPYLRNCFKVIIACQGHYLSTNSEAGRISYSEWLGVDPESLEVIHNGIDFHEMEARMGSENVKKRLHEFGISKENVIVGGVFRIEAGKRPELWLEAFSLAHEKEQRIRGVLVGGGRMLGAVKEWIVQRGLTGTVYLAGESDDVAAWLSEMDVFLFTSMTEGLPNVLIEAQGFGLPVVSTNVGGVPEVVQDEETGILVSSSSAAELSQAIVRLLESPKLGELRDKSISNARDNFSVRSMIQKTEDIYSRALCSSLGSV